MGAFGLEHGAALAVDQERDRVWEAAFGIPGRFVAKRFDEQCPAGAQALQRVIGSGTYRDELGIGRAVEIGAAEPARALQRAVLVEHDPGCDEPRPRQVVGEQHPPGSVFAEVEHAVSPRLRVQYGGAQPQVAREYTNELRFGPGQPDSRGMAENPDCEARNPELEANADRGGKGADGDRNRAGRSAEQDRLGQ